MGLRNLWIVTILLTCAICSFGALRADLNGDCRVDMQDLIILLEEWLQQDEDCLMGLGPELVTNGGFATADSWILDDWEWSESGWVFADEVVSSLYQVIDELVVGDLYRVSVKVLQADEGTTLSVRLSDGSTSFESLNPGEEAMTTQTITVDLVAGAPVIEFYTTTGYVEIDDVSVRKILGGAAAASVVQSYYNQMGR